MKSIELEINPHLIVDVDDKTGELLEASVYVPELHMWMGCKEIVLNNDSYMTRIQDAYACKIVDLVESNLEQRRSELKC